jgi:hypothetical protein
MCRLFDFPSAGQFIRYNIPPTVKDRSNYESAAWNRPKIGMTVKNFPRPQSFFADPKSGDGVNPPNNVAGAQLMEGPFPVRGGGCNIIRAQIRLFCRKT